MSSAALAPSVTAPQNHAPKQPELVLKEVRVIDDRRFHSKSTIHVAINEEEQTRSFSFFDAAGRKELIWKDQSRPVSADASVIVKCTSGKREKSVQVTFNHDELTSSARGGEECKRKIEGATMIFIVKLKPLSVDPKKMDDAAKMAERKSVLDSLERVQPALGVALKVSDVVKDIHPAVKATLGCVTVVFEALKKEQEINERVLALAKDIASMAHLLVVAQRFPTLAEVVRVLDEIREVMVAARELVEKRDGRHRLYKTVDVLFTLDEAEVQKLERSLRDSKATLDIALGVETLSATERNARSEKEDKFIQKIDPGYKLPHEWLLRCHPGTREDILSLIRRWTTDFDEPNILWISAYPGTGKTTIASHIASLLANEKRFGSFFSFNRTTEANPSVLWRMNCAKLADTYQPFLTFLFDKLKGFDFNNSTSDEVFNSFIYEPLRNWEMALGSELILQPPVIVVDALDECDSSERKSVLAAIAKWTQLPSSFKLIVTSRPEADIRDKISPISHRALEIYTGTGTSSKTHEDIQRFLTFCFDDIRSKYPKSLNQGWITQGDIADLMQRAAGVFMWVVTVAKYVSEDPERLSQILEGDLRDGDLFDLYQTLLNTSFPANSTPRSVMQTFHSIVSAIVVLQKPITEVNLRKLVEGMSALSVERVLKGLTTVLDSGKHLIFAHQSFIDFLTEHERGVDNDRGERNQIECPERFRIYTRETNRMVFESTFAYMVEKLKFNICGILSSFELNSPSSRAHADDTVEELLRYACQFWGFHISAWLSKPLLKQNTIVSVQVPLADFAEKKLLFWLEVLSGTGAYHAAFPALLQLRDCMRLGCVKDSQIQADVPDEIIALISDSLQFCRYFGPVLSSSVPHIYLLALPFVPTSSLVAKKHAEVYGNCLKLVRGQMARWPALQIAIRNGSRVISVAFSPDGKRVASGSDDSTIRMWDVETGQAIAEPFRGHEYSVLSVAFSPDGKRLASGSYDKTIRIWDVETGQIVAGPFCGHENVVYSVAFSPDGKRVASGSNDKTIRIWKGSAINVTNSAHYQKAKASTATATAPSWHLGGFCDRQLPAV